jgi:hypothetical protein
MDAQSLGEINRRKRKKPIRKMISIQVLTEGTSVELLSFISLRNIFLKVLVDQQVIACGASAWLGRTKTMSANCILMIAHSNACHLVIFDQIEFGFLHPVPLGYL